MLFAMQAEHQVLLHCQPREHRAMLRDHDAPRARAGHRRAIDAHCAAVGFFEAGDDVHQRRLAAAGRPDDRDELAVCHFETDTANDWQRREVLVHVLDADLVQGMGQQLEGAWGSVT
jgi:hypothetical protein